LTDLRKIPQHEISRKSV